MIHSAREAACGYSKRSGSFASHDENTLKIMLWWTLSLGRKRGLIDADLGSGLLKQRVARAGEGRSGGYRTIIAYRAGDRAVFLYGFAKNERDNIGDDELAT